MKLRRWLSAFTLIELLVVIAIIAVLAGIVLRTTSFVNKKIARANAISSLNKIRSAVEAFQRSAGIAADGVVGPQTAASLSLGEVPAPQPDTASAIPAVTAAMVAKMFPVTPVQNIEKHLPAVLDAMVAVQLTDKPMVLMALATPRTSRV